MANAYTDALRLLAGRELSVAECRARLIHRGHPADEVDAAIRKLLDDGSLSDERVARAYARTAIDVKGRGRVRIARELTEKGIAREVIAAALAELFADTDERSLVAQAIQKKLRSGPRPSTASDFGRLYQYLMRQGFSPAVVSAELRKLRGGRDDD